VLREKALLLSNLEHDADDEQAQTDLGCHRVSREGRARQSHYQAPVDRMAGEGVRTGANQGALGLEVKLPISSCAARPSGLTARPDRTERRDNRVPRSSLEGEPCSSSTVCAAWRSPA
jgi:hypothetical protein